MKRCFILNFLTLVSIIGFAGNYSTSMTPIIEKAEPIVKYVENEMNMEIVRMEYDILRTTKTTTRTLSADYTYAVIAFGDFRFTDIDVKVYRNVGGDWQLVEKDNDTDAMAVVAVKPPYDGEYMIEITAYSFDADYDVGHYGLIIAHE